MMWLINKQHVRDFLLAESKAGRSGRFKRVSATAYFQLNARVVQLCKDVVRRHPSIGQTIKEIL